MPKAGTPVRRPPVRWRSRVRGRLRRLKRRWRRAFPRSVPRWSDPAIGPAQDHHRGPAESVGLGAVRIDAGTANPRGRQSDGLDLPRGVLTLATGADGTWWQIRRTRRGGALVVAGRVGDPLDDRQSTALGRLGTIVIGADGPPVAVAAVAAQLAATGLVVHMPALVAEARALLGEELATLLVLPPPHRNADPVDWELRSIAQRRTALRGHALAGVGGPPAVSALLVTRRPARLAGAVAALAAQTYPDLEIVIGLHGFELPAALPDHGVPIRVVGLPERLSLGEALTEVTRAADGSLLTKVDDDDRYGPEHIWDLVLARHFSGATVAGKGAEFVHLEPYDVTVRRKMGSEMYADVVAGGTILVSRDDLAGVGGWQPVPRSVDRALLDRVLGAGGRIYRTHGFGFVYSRHNEGHTWDPGLGYFLLDPLRQWPGLPPYPEFGEVGQQGSRSTQGSTVR